MITSNQNMKIKQIRLLLVKARNRREQGLFVVEGVRLAEEALKSGWLPEAAYFAQSLNERGMQVVETLQAEGVTTEEVSDSVMGSVSDTRAPQGLLLALKLREMSLPEDANLVLILDQVRDPGNLGTIFRSAAAGGVDAVILTPGCTDPFSPKVLRAGMGANFRVPVLQMGWPEITAQLNILGLHPWLTEVNSGLPHYEADLTKPSALVIGGEAHGIGEEARSLNHSLIHIPMPGESESLNAAMAATVFIFEAVRQRTRS